MSDSTVTGLACTLPSTSLTQREAELQELLASATRIYESGDGIVGEFSGTDQMARTLLDAVLLERQCCAPLTYTLIFAPDHTVVSLKVQGAPQYRVAIKAWLAGKGRHVAPPSSTWDIFRRIVAQLWGAGARSRDTPRCRCGTL